MQRRSTHCLWAVESFHHFCKTDQVAAFINLSVFNMMENHVDKSVFESSRIT